MEPSNLEQRERLSGALAAQGISDARVLAALAEVPRHEFVPISERPHAYENRPLGIGHQQTISQPLIVALMTQLAEVVEGSRVLEVGTGSGYQTAILAALGADLFTIEIVEALALRARADLERLGLAGRIHFRIGDGWAGWEGAAPFDAIVVTAAPPVMPEALKAQLGPAGRLVIPVGQSEQELWVVRRTAAGFDERVITPVSFVPMTGEAALRQTERTEPAPPVRPRPLSRT